MGDYFTRMWFSDLCVLRYDDADAVNKAEVQACREKLAAIWQELSAAYDMRLPDPEQDMVAVEKTLLLVNDTAPNPTAPILWNRMCQLMSTAQKRLWMVTPYLVMDSAMRDDLTAVCASAPEDLSLIHIYCKRVRKGCQRLSQKLPFAHKAGQKFAKMRRICFSPPQNRAMLSVRKT